MQRRFSSSDLSTTKLSPHNPLLFFTNEERQLQSEEKKVVTYLAARRLFRNALSAIDPGFDGFHAYVFFSSGIDKIDKLLSTIPEAMWFDSTFMHMKETHELLKVDDTTDDIAQQYSILVRPGNNNSDEFSNEVQRAITEKTPEKLTKREMDLRQDLLLMTEVLNAFVKCGAMLSFRKFFEKISAEDQQTIINKHGLGMLHHAISFKQVEFVKQMLRYGVDVNAIHQIKHIYPNGNNPDATHASLGFAVLLLINVFCPEQERQKLYSEVVKFLIRRPDGEKNDYQAKPFTMPDLMAELSEIKEIIKLLQSHGAKNSEKLYTFGLVKDSVEGKERPTTISEDCEMLKRELSDLPDLFPHIDENILKGLNDAFDMIISAPQQQNQERVLPRAGM